MSRKIKGTLCTSLLASLLGMSAPVNAADIRPPVYKAPPAVAPPFSWTGFYIGANVGAGWNQGTVTDSLFGVNFSKSSDAAFVGGGQIGVNYQINNFVLGVEGDFDWLANNNNSGAGTVIGGNTFQVTSNNRWITTLAGRAGIAADRWLYYLKGGGGWVGNSGFTVTNVTTGTSVTGSGSNSNSGWLLGGGVEWAFADNWSVRAEYDFLGLSSRSFATPATVPVIGGDVFTLHDRDVQMLTVGINYRFNWPNAVAASY